MPSRKFYPGGQPQPPKTLLDHKFVVPGEKPSRVCNLTAKIQKLVTAGVIQTGQLTDIVADHDEANCLMFHGEHHGEQICTCDPVIRNLKGERLA